MMDNREYIKDIFENDGIKAPESLSEENMLKMLESEDKKDGIVTIGPDSKSETVTFEKTHTKVQPRVIVKRFMAVAAALIVCIFGISGFYTVLTTAPDTSETNGQLYTFRSDGEVKRMIRSMNYAPLSEYFTRRTYNVVEDYDRDYGALGDSEVTASEESYESNYASEPKSMGAQGSSSSSGSSHSDTHLQVEDVDESDIVKTDGKYIYYVNSNQEVVILSAKDGETEKVGTIGSGSVENYVEDIYLKGDTLVTVGKFYTGDDEGSSGLVVYDISDRSKPVMVSNFRQSGDIVTSRMVGDYVYLVTNDHMYTGKRYLPMSGSGDSYRSLSPSDISCLPEPKSCSYVVLSAVDIKSGEQSKSKTKAVFGATKDIYCNDHALYSVSQEWGNNSGENYTRIARASLDGLDISFNGTARVRGRIVNRFAMDEKNGYFRIATTSQRNGMDVNNLYVLDPSMNETGKVTGFARNESIKAVRYIGDKAYVITYEAIDPLFIIDLKDPADPRIEGEVMIDGFSTLLVPAGNGRLLGVGHATGDNGYGGQYDSGLKIALFDISDPSHPAVLDSKEFEDMTSPAQSDSHALIMNKEEGWFAIPYGITTYSNDWVVIEDDAEAPEVSVDGEWEEEPAYTEPEKKYEGGVLVFGAKDTISDVDQHALGSEYIERCVYIGDWVYALDRRGGCMSFKRQSSN